MEDKLRKLMKHEGLNSTRLAEMLGIQASGISHIMSGRNKPSYDFIVKLLHRFPQINPDWLLSDKGPMYRTEIKSKNPASPQVSLNDSGAPIENASSSLAGDLFSSKSPASRQTHDIQSLERDDSDIIPAPAVNLSAAADGKQQQVGVSGTYAPFVTASTIERIVVFYKDKTFTEYQPG